MNFLKAGFLSHKFVGPEKVLKKFDVYKSAFIFFSEERIHSSVYPINKSVCDHNMIGKYFMWVRDKPSKNGHTLDYLRMNYIIKICPSQQVMKTF